jgi:hypothetical protein
VLTAAFAGEAVRTSTPNNALGWVLLGVITAALLTAGAAPIRSAPGARPAATKANEEAEEAFDPNRGPLRLRVTDQRGKAWSIDRTGAAQDSWLLLAFLSPICSSCEDFWLEFSSDNLADRWPVEVVIMADTASTLSARTFSATGAKVGVSPTAATVFGVGGRPYFVLMRSETAIEWHGRMGTPAELRDRVGAEIDRHAHAGDTTHPMNETTVLVRSSGIATQPLVDSVIVYDVLLGETHRINDSAAEILDHIDGRRTLREIARQLARVHALHEDELVDAVIPVAASFEQLRLVTRARRPAAESPSVPTSDAAPVGDSPAAVRPSASVPSSVDLSGSKRRPRTRPVAVIDETRAAIERVREFDSLCVEVDGLLLGVYVAPPAAFEAVRSWLGPYLVENPAPEPNFALEILSRSSDAAPTANLLVEGGQLMSNAPVTHAITELRRRLTHALAIPHDQVELKADAWALGETMSLSMPGGARGANLYDDRLRHHGFLPAGSRVLAEPRTGTLIVPGDEFELNADAIAELELLGYAPAECPVLPASTFTNVSWGAAAGTGATAGAIVPVEIAVKFFKNAARFPRSASPDWIAEAVLAMAVSWPGTSEPPMLPRGDVLAAMLGLPSALDFALSSPGLASARARIGQGGPQDLPA